MSTQIKAQFLRELASRFGHVQRLEGSQSLYDIANGAIRIYIRYSKRHGQKQTFFGLRHSDLKKLEGRPSILCFLWDNQTEPLLVPFSRYEAVFLETSPALDGQYKTQIYLDASGTQMYIARAGRHGVDSYYGWNQLVSMLAREAIEDTPELGHSQIQTLLGAIGVKRNCDVWIPQADRGKLDWSLSERFGCREFLPDSYAQVKSVLQEVDVVWIQRGSSELQALFEIEHSTPIYSGLLRFNDIHLTAPQLRPRFSIVADTERRQLFVRQIHRPTFEASSLSTLCEFMDYRDVYRWYHSAKQIGLA